MGYNYVIDNMGLPSFV